MFRKAQLHSGLDWLTIKKTHSNCLNVQEQVLVQRFQVSSYFMSNHLHSFWEHIYR